MIAILLRHWVKRLPEVLFYIHTPKLHVSLCTLIFVSGMLQSILLPQKIYLLWVATMQR